MREWSEPHPMKTRALLAMAFWCGVVVFAAWRARLPAVKPVPADFWTSLGLAAAIGVAFYGLNTWSLRRRGLSVQETTMGFWVGGFGIALCSMPLIALGLCARLDQATWRVLTTAEPKGALIELASYGDVLNATLGVACGHFVASVQHYFKLRKTDATSA